MDTDGKIVIATTTLYDSLKNYRVELALKTIHEACKTGLRIVVLDAGSPIELHRVMSSFGAHVIPSQHATTMGTQRRRVLAQAAEDAGPDGAVIWMEPEKWPLIHDIKQLAEPVMSGKADMAMASRSPAGWETHPLEQVYVERFGNRFFNRLVASRTHDVSFDVWFAPFAVNRAALQPFLLYDGEFGDRWDAIHIPRLNVIAEGLRVVSVEMENYFYPPEQRKAEEEDINMMLKRVDQLGNLVSAFHKRALALDLISA